MTKSPKTKLFIVTETVDDLIRRLQNRLQESGFGEISILSGEAVKEHYDELAGSLMIIDSDLRNLPAVELVDRLKRIDANASFVVMVGRANITTGAELLKQGALGYFVKDEYCLELAPSVINEALNKLEQLKEREINEKSLQESEGIFKSLADRANFGIIILQDGIIKYASPSLERMSGYMVKELVGSAFIQYIHPSKRKEAQKTHNSRFTKGDINQIYESVLVHKDGREVYTEISGGVITYKGKPADLVVLRDVSSTHRYEKALESSEERYRSLVENMTEGIVIQDENGVLTYANENLCKMMNCPLEELIGKSDVDLLDKENQQIYSERFRQLKRGEKESYELTVIRKDGAKMDILVSPQLITDYDGNFRGSFAVITDVTETKRREEQLRRLSQALEQSPSIIMILDAGGIVEHVNPQFIEVTGYDFQQVVGKGLWKFVGNTKEEIAGILKTVSSAGRFQGEFGNLKENGDLYIESALITPIKNKAGQITHYLKTSEDVTERKKGEAALLESESKYKALIEQSEDAIYILADDEFKLVNSKFLDIFNLTQEEIDSPDFNRLMLIADESQEMLKIRKAMRERGEILPSQFLCTGLSKDGRRMEVSVSETLISYQGKPAVQGVLRDISAKRKDDADLHQSQKMEAMGRLAGGIAHDFNNLLTAIMGNCDLAMMSVSQDSQLHGDLMEIRKAAEIASTLTEQLLCFSRKQVVEHMVIDLALTITNMKRMLERILGEHIALETNIAADLWKVKADPGQIEQLIVNLAVNSRDAMPNGGRLSIELQNLEIKDDLLQRIELKGIRECVLITVRDNGVGMTEEIKSKIFDPFYTTKEIGEGTGLGLFSVYAIVKQSGGYIEVFSQLDEGTTFKIYFPRVEEEIEEWKLLEPAVEIPRGNETLMMVEDEESVRKTLTGALKRLGYKVLSANDGTEALRLAQKMKKPAQLLITDVVMPNMSGIELAKQLRSKWPKLKVIYISGYAQDVIDGHLVDETETYFIPKPFRPAELAVKLREVLDS